MDDLLAIFHVLVDGDLWDKLCIQKWTCVVLGIPLFTNPIILH